MMYDWETDTEKVLSRLKLPAAFKICTKNLNEPELIESWITHHAAIVGLRNLIIADNGSTHPETLRVYCKYCNHVTIFSFTGQYDEIHSHPRFSPFFEAIRSSTRFYAVFDTDERLVFLEEDHWRADSSILKLVAEQNLDFIIPTTWLINLMNRSDCFGFQTTEGDNNFINNLVWGKPILPGRLAGMYLSIHNTQFPLLHFASTYKLNLFLLHLTQFPNRRLQINKDKLVKSGTVTPDMSYEQIAALNANGSRFIYEIRLMLNAKRSASKAESPQQDFIELKSDGTLTYSSNVARSLLKNFIRNPNFRIKDGV